LPELIERQVHQAEHLLRLVPGGVVLLHHIERHEEGVHASFLHARQIHLPVGQAIPDAPTQVELAVDHVDVPVEDEGLVVQPAGLLRHPGRLLPPARAAAGRTAGPRQRSGISSECLLRVLEEHR